MQSNIRIVKYRKAGSLIAEVSNLIIDGPPIIAQKISEKQANEIIKLFNLQHEDTKPYYNNKKYFEITYS